MFEKFQQLTPLQRSLIVLVPLLIVIALIVLIYRADDASNSQATSDPSSSASPTPSYQAPSGTATSVAPYALNTPPADSKAGKDTPDTTKKYSNAQKTQAQAAAYRAMIAYCRYVADETPQEHLDRLKPYYAPGDFNLGTGDVVAIIKTQQCTTYTNAELTSLTDDGALTYGLAVQQATIFQAGSPVVGGQSDSGKDIAYSKPISMQASMKLVKGKWLAESITSSNGE